MSVSIKFNGHLIFYDSFKTIAKYLSIFERSVPVY